MTRQTSIEAYREIKANGLLSALRFDVYHCLFNHGPLTQMETCRKVQKEFPHRTDHSVSPRFAELDRLGVIEEVGQKICEVTGRMVILWDVTKNLPRKLEKKKSRNQLLVDALKEIKGIAHQWLRCEMSGQQIIEIAEGALNGSRETFTSQ